MEKVLPIYYSEYGRYLTRFRSIPFYVDCLIPVQRRILLGVYERAKEKMTKSATIVGHVVGSYHPHGDQSAYGSLVNLVTQNLIDKQGNWGSEGLYDSPPAAFRYTECKMNKLIKELAFEYINYVPWGEYEFENEPLYLPSPIPLGLIGHGIYTGIAFHRPLIPKYEIKDLAKRLIGLLSNDEKNKEIIKPNIKNNTVIDETEDQKQFEKILVEGTGRITCVPDGEIKKNNIYIKGRAPNSSFNKLIDACEKDSESKKKVIDATLTDLSKKGINIEITPDKRKVNINQLAQQVWNDYLIKRYNINVVTCNENGEIVECGIDTILLNNYQAWQHAVFLKNIDDTHKLFRKKRDMGIIYIIREIITKYNAKNVNDIKTYYNQNYKNTSLTLENFDFDKDSWIAYSEQITESDIESICNRKSIKSLVEIEIDLNQIDQEIQNQKTKLSNTKIDCFQRLKTYT